MEADASEFLSLLSKLDTETTFMMLEPGERSTNVADQRERIREIISRDNRAIFVARNGKALVGYIAALGGSARRNRHCAHVVIGVIKQFAGHGVGTMLFQKLELWARTAKIHRLELSVMIHNERAIGLYKKMGFNIEGTKTHSLSVDSEYVSEYYMARLLTSVAGK